MQISDILAEFGRSTPRDCEDARQMVRLSIFDWAACGLAGVDEPVARILKSRVIEDGGRPEASLFGGGLVPARAAALANGTTSHALDYDDTHFAHIGHPSVAVVPAALALAETTQADVEAVIDAVLIGVEASVRVGLWLGRDHYLTGFHQTATAGAFGAALAAARLLRLNHDQTVHALGLAATRASGLKSQFGTMGKPYNAGIAAETGVEVARLAAQGMVSNPQAMDVAQGFGSSHAGLAVAQAFDGIGNSYLFEGVSHKFHACCHGTHAAIEALLVLNPDPLEVDQIAIETHPAWMTVCNKPRADTGLEAKFSYKVIIAMVLAGVDTGNPDSFADDLAKDPSLSAWADRVTVTQSAKLTETQANLRVTLKDGSSSLGFHDLLAPITLPAREARLAAKAASILGAERAEALWRAVNGRDLAGLTGVLTV